MEFVHDFRRVPGADPTRALLDRALRLLACFQQALGHELPNRLVAVQGLARVLELEYSERLDAAGRAGLTRLADLVRGVDELVRTLAHIGRQQRDAEPATLVNLAEVVGEAIAEVKWLYPDTAVDYEDQMDRPEVVVSRRDLSLALHHLLRNAVRAGAAGRPLQVRVAARAGRDGVDLSVEDNGVGLTGRSDPFEPFPPGKDGLGLFQVRQLVAGWNGTVRLRSEAGQGTTVTLFLPEPAPILRGSLS